MTHPTTGRRGAAQRAGLVFTAACVAVSPLAATAQEAQPAQPAQRAPAARPAVVTPVAPPAPAAPAPIAPRPASGQTAPDVGSPTQATLPQSDGLKSKTPVTLNFVNADIEAVTRAIGAMINRQFLVDPRVKGSITLYAEQPLTVREAYLNYLAALRGLGFAVIEAGGLLKVVPEAEAKIQTGTVQVGSTSTRGDQIITQIFRLNHENVNNLVPVLRPLISPNNTINANPGSNTLVITDYAENLQRIAKIIAAMDTPTASDIEVIPLKHAVATDIAPLVQRLADGTASPATPGAAPNAPQGVPGAASQGGSVIADPRSNSLIVRAVNPARNATIRAIIDKLDRPIEGGGPAGNIYVVYLRNADATRLATVLRAAYAAGNTGGTGAGAGGGGGTNPLQQTTQPTTTLGGGLGNQSSIGGNASPQATAPITPTAAPSTGGFIQADPATNSLIITAPEPLYRQLRAVIDQLDSKRVQIFIESMIVEMDAQKAADFGFQWQGLWNVDGKHGVVAGTNYGSSNIIDLAAAGAVGGTTGAQSARNAIGTGLNIGLLRNFGGVTTLAALARFLESNTGANILSTPNIVTLDNEESKFVNGQNLPFVTGQFTNTVAAGAGGTINPFQTIDRRDVGLTLRVRPQVGEGGKVRMTIFQENSSVVAGTTNSVTNSAGPITNKSSIESTVEVDDGAIMVLGGLLKDEYSNTNDKVPVLGDVPVVGGLFRSENRTRRKTNLMVFLRPVVIRNAGAADQITLDRYDLIRALQRDQQPQPSSVLPINEAPVLPPLRAPGSTLPTAPDAPPRTPVEPTPRN